MSDSFSRPEHPTTSDYPRYLIVPFDIRLPGEIYSSLAIFDYLDIN